MPGEYFTVVTDVGISKMAEAIREGKKVNIVEFAVGDGGGKPCMPEKGMERLRNEVWRGVVNECRASKGHESRVIIETVMPGDIGGFTIREMGVFDEYGDMVAICNTPETQKAVLDDGLVQEMSLYIEIELSNTEGVQIFMNPKAAATKEELEEHILDMESHVTPEKQEEWNAKQDALTIDSVLSSTSTNPIQNKAVKAALDRKSSTGHTHSAATTAAAGFMSAADKQKLNGINENANNYTHPATHPATMVSQDATHRFVSDAEKQAWDGTYEQSTGYTDQKIADLIGGDPETLGTLKDFAEAVKENGDLITAMNESIGKKANQAELDTHTGNSTIHVTASDRQRWDAKQDALTIDSDLSNTSANPVQNKAVKAALDGKSSTGHTHSAATTAAAGFMSAADKRKLEGVELDKFSTYSLTSTSANMDADLKAFFDSLKDGCFTVYMAAGATYRVDGYKSGKYGILRRSVYVSSKNAVSTDECVCLNGTWGGWHMVYTDASKPSPADIGAVSSDYLAGHFVPDFVSQKGMELTGVGWKKIAELSRAIPTMASCVVDIKREYNNLPDEYHRFQLISTQKQSFAPIIDKIDNQVITRARLVTGASGKCYIEIYYNYTGMNHASVTVENAVSDEYNGVITWKVIDPVADTEIPSAGTVAATYDIPESFNSNMLAMKDGSNVDGIWGNLTAGAVFGEYTQNGGEQAPGYVASNHVKFNMMRKFKGLTDKAGTYMDCMMMDCYDGNDIPYVTAFGIRKGSGSPRAFIAVGQKGNNSSWTSQEELLTTENIASQTAGKANALSNTSAIGDGGRPVYIGDDGVPKPLTNNAGDYYTPAYMYGGKIHGCTNSFVKMEKFFDGSFQSNSYQRIISIYDIVNDRKVSKVSGTSSYVVMLRAVGGSRYGGFMEDFALVFALSDTAAGGVVTSKDVLIGGDNVGRIYFKVAKSDCSTTSVDIQCMVSEGANLTINRIYAVFV